MRTALEGIAAVVGTLIILMPVPALAHHSEAHQGGAEAGIAGNQGTGDVDVVVGEDGSIDDGADEPSGLVVDDGPDGEYVRYSVLDSSQAPPCVTTASEFFPGVSREAADRIELTRETGFITYYESLLSQGDVYLPCEGAVDTGLASVIAQIRSRLPVAAGAGQQLSEELCHVGTRV